MQSTETVQSETAQTKTAVVHLQIAEDKTEKQIYSDFFKLPSADKLATIQENLTQTIIKLQKHHEQDLSQVLKHYENGVKNMHAKFEHYSKFCELLERRAHWKQLAHVFHQICKNEKDNLSKYARQELLVAEYESLDANKEYQINALASKYNTILQNEKEMVEHCQAWWRLCEERKNSALKTHIGTIFVYFACNFNAYSKYAFVQFD